MESEKTVETISPPEPADVNTTTPPEQPIATPENPAPAAADPAMQPAIPDEEDDESERVGE